MTLVPDPYHNMHSPALHKRNERHGVVGGVLDEFLGHARGGARSGARRPTADAAIAADTLPMPMVVASATADAGWDCAAAVAPNAGRSPKASCQGLQARGRI